jgi:hypothetical protein
VVMVAMWHIWDARNKAREGDGLLHPHAVATKVKVYVDMIIQHLYKPAPTHTSGMPVLRHGSLPYASHNITWISTLCSFTNITSVNDAQKHLST